MTVSSVQNKIKINDILLGIKLLLLFQKYVVFCYLGLNKIHIGYKINVERYFFILGGTNFVHMGRKTIHTIPTGKGGTR